MSSHPASLSSIAPAGLFYSMASLSPIGTVVDLATHPALADGGNRLPVFVIFPLDARCVSHERRVFLCNEKEPSRAAT